MGCLAVNSVLVGYLTLWVPYQEKCVCGGSSLANECARMRECVFFFSARQRTNNNVCLSSWLSSVFFSRMLTRVLSKKLGKAKKLEWEVFCPRVIPTMTAFGLTFFVCAAKGNCDDELGLMCLRVRPYAISRENMLSVSGVRTR